jgi:hypothetical protein
LSKKGPESSLQPLSQTLLFHGDHSIVNLAFRDGVWDSKELRMGLSEGNQLLKNRALLGGVCDSKNQMLDAELRPRVEQEVVNALFVACDRDHTFVFVLPCHWAASAEKGPGRSSPGSLHEVSSHAAQGGLRDADTLCDGGDSDNAGR